ncbi:CotH kinase family protein [Nocardia fluminea]|uniref:CotH kinase family protein n=1 Tax=Nocardia fluminea TaxID=134984 RepID=UPI00366A09D6
MTAPPYNTPGSPPKLRFRHRLPKAVRQNWKLPAALAAFVTVLATVFGSTPIRPLITGDASVIASSITDNVAGTVDLFDESIAHNIDVDINPAEYQDIIQTYEKEGEKDWASADVTIDGTLLTDVAVRLKGNSTLRTLRGTDTVGGPLAAEAMPFEWPQLSADDPASLPLLISFNEYVEGRAYQGMTELSVRPGAPALNESTGLELTAESGQPSHRYAYVVYSVNDSATETRLVLEHPDEGYAESLSDSNNVLYKVTADAKFSYQGEDQTTYAEQFTQINGQGTVDMQPVISFLRWLDAADDATFDQELDEWIEIDSFAEYAATQNLLVNFDDIAGPGRNGFLSYNLDTKKFSVISWDLNLILQIPTEPGPHDSIALPIDPTKLPAGNSHRVALVGNALKDRYLASTAFIAGYDNAYRMLYEQLFASGRAVEILREVSATIPVSDHLTREAIDAETVALEQRLTTRTESLAKNQVILRP